MGTQCQENASKGWNLRRVYIQQPQAERILPIAVPEYARYYLFHCYAGSYLQLA
jgi:hypothetical protein